MKSKSQIFWSFFVHSSG